MKIQDYLDSTYLKTALQANLSEEANNDVVKKVVLEAIQEKFKLVMIRPEQVVVARQLIDDYSSDVLVGTVIDFPHGQSLLEDKLLEAKSAINDGVDELDFVINYTEFKHGNIDNIKAEVIACASLGLEFKKVVKFIIEVAALSDDEIIRICTLIKHAVIENFKESEYCKIFVKSSTGFYPTTEGKPNGATVSSIVIMLENSFPLPVKAAGGVRTLSEAKAMISLGVKRIGTSSAKSICNDELAVNGY